MVGQMTVASDRQAGVALHRRQRAGRYERVDLDSFAVLRAHLLRAISIGIELGTLRTFGTWRTFSTAIPRLSSCLMRNSESCI